MRKVKGKGRQGVTRKEGASRKPKSGQASNNGGRSSRASSGKKAIKTSGGATKGSGDQVHRKADSVNAAVSQQRSEKVSARQPFAQVTYRDVLQEFAGQRLDNHLLSFLKGVPKSRLYRLIRKGELRVNGKRAKPEYRLQAGDRIRVPPLRVAETESDLPSLPFLQKKLPLEKLVLFENRSLLVVDKPTGTPVHGGSGQPWGMIEALRVLRPDLHYVELVHRLDIGTSGVLLLAKKRSVLKALHRALVNHSLDKRYLMLVKGHLPKSHITVDMPLNKNIREGGERMVRVARDGQVAITHFEVMKRFADVTLVSARLETGRTHQIRVHAQYLGHPIVGDSKYGDQAFNSDFKNRYGIERMWLHAVELGIPNYSDDECLNELAGCTFTAPIEPVLEQVLERLPLPKSR